MARNKPQQIIGRIAIIAAIYDPDNLPSAIIAINDHTPYCLHSLREEDLSFFETTFLREARAANGFNVDKDDKDEELKVKFYKFFEDYPEQGHICIGCRNSDKADSTHKIHESKEACTKSTEECA